MSLRLWLPLTNTVENLGLENCEFTTNNITSVDGKINQYAAHFNGNNSWISIKNPPDLNITDFSFAFWLKTYADTDGMCIYNGRTKAGNPIAIFIINGSIRFDDGALHSNLLTIEKNKWYHIVITRDSNNIKTYLNGNLCETTSSTSFALNKITYASIGCSSTNSATPNSYPLNGDLNDFRIYDHCLSIKEIKELSKGLILHYKLSKSLNSNLITTDFVATATKSSYYKSHDTIEHLLTPEIIMANKGRTLWFSYDIYSPGTRKRGTNDNDTINNRFGIHFNITYNDGTKNVVDYPLSAQLEYSGGLTRIKKSYTIPSDIVSISDFYTGIQCGSPEFASPADDNDETWYIKNLKLEWDTPTPYSPHTEYDNDDIEYDYSGYGNHAIANSDIKSNSDSYLYNSCREFNGDKQWFTIQNPLRKIFNDDFTVSVWVNISYRDRGVILSNNYKSPVIAFELKAIGTFRLYWNGTTDFSGNITFPLNTWHNIIFTRNNNTLKIYVDGILDNSITPDSLPALNITALSRVGDDYRGDTDNTVSFPGKMSDLRIYATALSEDDIKELYNVPTSLDNNGNIFTGELIEED